jgi:hypothetical protein
VIDGAVCVIADGRKKNEDKNSPFQKHFGREGKMHMFRVILINKRSCVSLSAACTAHLRSWRNRIRSTTDHPASARAARSRRQRPAECVEFTPKNASLRQAVCLELFIQYLLVGGATTSARPK